MGTGYHMARILKQGTKGCMGGGRGEELRGQLHLQSAEKDSHPENMEHFGDVGGDKAELRRDSFSTLTI